MWCWPGQSTPDQGVPVCRRRGRDATGGPAGGIYIPFCFSPLLTTDFTRPSGAYGDLHRHVLGPFRGFRFRFSSFWVWGYVTGEKSEQKKRLNGAPFQALAPQRERRREDAAEMPCRWPLLVLTAATRSQLSFHRGIGNLVFLLPSGRRANYCYCDLGLVTRMMLLPCLASFALPGLVRSGFTPLLACYARSRRPGHTAVVVHFTVA
jgi:hypothetical protein